MVVHASHRKGVQWEEVDDLQKVASKVDVLYQTRIQKERFLDRLEDYESARGKYIIDADLMKILPHSSIVMHPLPRVDEVCEPVALHDCLDLMHPKLPHVELCVMRHGRPRDKVRPLLLFPTGKLFE